MCHKFGIGMVGFYLRGAEIAQIRCILEKFTKISPICFKVWCNTSVYISVCFHLQTWTLSPRLYS